MTSHFAVLAIDAVQPAVLAPFWCDVLGWEVIERDEDIVSIGPTNGPGPTIDLLRVPEAKSVKNRLHLDLRPDSSTTQADEVTRLINLGARRIEVGQTPDVTWVVLADPEGNEFCIL